MAREPPDSGVSGESGVHGENPGHKRGVRSAMNSQAIRRGKEGQGLVEYALILFLVAIVVFAALALIGPGVGSLYSSIYSGL